MRECHQKTNYRNFSLLQFLNFSRAPVFFKVKSVDLDEKKIGIEYIIGHKGQWFRFTTSIANDLKVNDKGQYKVCGFLLDMLNITLADGDEKVVSDDKYYSDAFIEEGLICSEFLYFDGFLEKVGK